MALVNLKNNWTNLQERYGEARVNGLAIIILIGIASLAVRLLIHYNFDTSALLYIGIPYLIALAITMVRPVRSFDKWWHQYRDHSLTALTVFFASSIVLFEGFICVLLFLPIYFLGVSIVFLIRWYLASRNDRRGSTLISILPLLIVASSFEGTTDALSVERENHVVVTRVTNLSPAEIMDNIATPFDLRKDRDWLISIFPMPYEIEAGSLVPGDIHRVRTRYHRWFVTNTHEGELLLLIVDVTPDSIRTKFIKDTTFFSSYLEPLSTEITLNQLKAGRTEISLRIDYRRKLDPAWYFQPLQQYAVAQMADFLIDEVMIRE